MLHPGTMEAGPGVERHKSPMGYKYWLGTGHRGGKRRGQRREGQGSRGTGRSEDQGVGIAMNAACHARSKDRRLATAFDEAEVDLHRIHHLVAATATATGALSTGTGDRVGNEHDCPRKACGYEARGYGRMKRQAGRCLQKMELGR